MVDFGIRNKPGLSSVTLGLLSGLAITAPACEPIGLEQLSAAVATVLATKFDATLDGGLTIRFAPAECQASLAAVTAAAECDMEIDPATMKASCDGNCEVASEVAVDCTAIGTLECVGQAPNFACGTCEGDCQLQAAGVCEGTCHGACDGECSACTVGVCAVDGLGSPTCG